MGPISPAAAARNLALTVIVSERFAGLNRVKAQQLVYAQMGEWMGREIHALSMQTFTPENWAQHESGPRE